MINKNHVQEKIDRGVYNGYKNTKKIRTAYGYDIECSDNHPIMIKKDDGEIDFVLASDLKVGDKVLISTKNDIWGDNLEIEAFNVLGKYMHNNYSEFFIKELNENIAKFLGFFLAAGVLNENQEAFFEHPNVYVSREYNKLIRELGFVQTYHRDRQKKKNYTTQVWVYYWLQGMGYGYKTAANKRIPDCIMRAPKKIVASFLQGLFEAGAVIEDDNDRITMTTKSCELAKQVHLLLLNFGIISSLRTREFKNKTGTYYYLKIYGENVDKFKEEINFASNSKRKRLTNICRYYRYIDINKYKEEYFLDKIEKIEDGQAHVYDISVPDTHSFVSNGFISHNTWGEVISMFIIAVLYPGITMALTAQTKANAAKLLKDKYDEITRQYPLLKNEMLKPRVSKDDFELSFTNGSRIDVLANAQTSKGQRRNRIQIEESALIDNTTFEDALKPIVEIGRTTQGKLGVPDPQELNQSINFFTTSGFRGSDEWARSVQMYKDMVDLKGEIVLGSGWMLGCWMGRGSNKNQILKKKRDTGSVAFARNYEEKWVGAVDNQLVDINKLLKTRVLTQPLMSNDDTRNEFVIGVDVARSANNANNKTIISVIQEHRADNGLIRYLDLVNMYLVSNQLNFTAQACLVKRVQLQYNAKVVVVDTNGLGAGLRDELLKPNVDVQTGESYLPWDTINGDIKSEYKEAIPMLYALNSQNKDDTKKDGRINNYAIINFIDCVDGQKLRLLEERKDSLLNLGDIEEVKAFVPFEQTNALVEEISNLKIKHLTNGEVTVEKVLRKIDKDRFSSLIYALWWAMSYDNVLKKDNKDLVMTIAKMNKIGSRRGNSLNSLFR